MNKKQLVELALNIADKKEIEMENKKTYPASERVELIEALEQAMVYLEAAAKIFEKLNCKQTAVEYRKIADEILGFINKAKLG